jgi:Matrixin
MSRRAAGWLATMALLVPLTAGAQEGDAWTLQAMDATNGVLKAQWMDIRVEQVELLSLDRIRAVSHLHRQPFRWVAGDSRRSADGNRLTYLFDRTDGPGGGVVGESFEAAFDRAVASWAGVSCLVPGIVSKRYSGGDPDIFDAQFGFGGLGDWQAADIVFGGWMPPSFFEAVAGAGSGKSVLAMSVTFIFVDRDGAPTDVDGDQFIDTAANEIYFNDGFTWQIGGGFDVETVALHEIGHSLGVGHIGPQPRAAMNPVYTGVYPVLRPVDQATACSLYALWHSDEER